MQKVSVGGVYFLSISASPLVKIARLTGTQINYL